MREPPAFDTSDTDDAIARLEAFCQVLRDSLAVRRQSMIDSTAFARPVVVKLPVPQPISLRPKPITTRIPQLIKAQPAHSIDKPVSRQPARSYPALTTTNIRALDEEQYGSPELESSASYLEEDRSASTDEDVISNPYPDSPIVEAVETWLYDAPESSINDHAKVSNMGMSHNTSPTLQHPRGINRKQYPASLQTQRQKELANKRQFSDDVLHELLRSGNIPPDRFPHFFGAQTSNLIYDGRSRSQPQSDHDNFDRL